MSSADHNVNEFRKKRLGSFNWSGFRTLYEKEVRRYIKVFGQTVGAPVVTTLMFMMIFTLALGGEGRYMGDVPYAVFLAPGLIIMSMLQNSFANTSSSIIGSKMQGNIIDILLAPIGAKEITMAYAFGGMTRGLMVGCFVMVAMSIMTDVSFMNIWAILYFGISGTMMLSLLGIMTGIWGQRFDQTSAINNFVIMPLSFLSGTFYSIDRLSGVWYQISQVNPFFYLIDGFRYGFTGQAEANTMIGVLYILAINVTLWVCCYRMFKSGYKLRA
ncbi:ABC transporter permease [Pseudemcibacter aquimaris]|uniref:ABC transporter permease n=1 Tax=Pseudemcibacter aquimaris TaxID=2857064 RepID=UPI002013B843|nr:ABC transporter permease [Pseudemcibacter aquimaris]MCC3860247.1 ABC transporter permease [Pseudemcibacter aquimaris]WDU57572.1 ABC transporter permease [Pseudemcibacter aquimaris]